MRTSKCHGWVLTFLSSNCFPEFKIPGYSRNNPYSRSHISNIPNLCKKIHYDEDQFIDKHYVFNTTHLKFIFSEHTKICCVDMDNDFLNSIEDKNEVVILCRDSLSSEDFDIDYNTMQHFSISCGKHSYELVELIVSGPVGNKF